MKIKLNSLWDSYELIDCGNLKKLERFSDIILIRPEISAKNIPKLSELKWKELASAEFIETSKNFGSWHFLKDISNEWQMYYQNSPINIYCKLSFFSSKHLGIFPEQILNWEFLKNFSKQNKILNLFAYTGLTSIAATAVFEQLTHVDSIKKTVEKAKQNARLSEIENIRFIIDDAQKFVLREIKRGNKYSGIILDPPQIGVGTKNEKWNFDEMIEDLLNNITKILENKSFVIMNLYSSNLTDIVVNEYVQKYFSRYKINFCEKVFGESKYGNTIDHGYFIRLIGK
ncbi:MAG: class I SAM-dependent methyltransferase [Bacteroidales bacterium]|jgi:23S rRNA (cytosine1962-C5)-methyltransferase|nr:class I SAM-dependent methyltransferase [Bacteroidales bacterium]